MLLNQGNKWWGLVCLVCTEKIGFKLEALACLSRKWGEPFGLMPCETPELLAGFPHDDPSLTPRTREERPSFLVAWLFHEDSGVLVALVAETTISVFSKSEKSEVFGQKCKVVKSPSHLNHFWESVYLGRTGLRMVISVLLRKKSPPFENRFRLVQGKRAMECGQGAHNPSPDQCLDSFWGFDPWNVLFSCSKTQLSFS